jgi:hypothetical protein
VNKNTRTYISKQGPEFINPYLIIGDPNAFKCQPITDGDYTIVQLTLHGEIIAYGVAKRHPNDAHNRDLGMALALTRAFTDAATRYGQTTDHLLNPPGDPAQKVIDGYRRQNKAERQKVKDRKRKAARETHRAVYGWDHTDRPA